MGSMGVHGGHVMYGEYGLLGGMVYEGHGCVRFMGCIK